MAQGRRVGTLGDLVRQRQHLWLTCWHCRRHVQVDVLAMIERHGDMPLQHFLDRSRCLHCNRGNVDMTAPPDVGELGKYRYPTAGPSSVAPLPPAAAAGP